MPDSHPSTPQTIDAAYQSGRRVGLATAALALAIVSFLNLLGTEKSILAAVLRFAPKFIDVMTFGITLHVVALLVLLHRLVVILNDQPATYSPTSVTTPR